MTSPAVWVLCINHRHGTNVEVYLTEEGAIQGLADYVEGQWENEITSLEDSPEKPSDPEEMVDAYFEFMSYDESYEIAYTHLNGWPDGFAWPDPNTTTKGDR